MLRRGPPRVLLGGEANFFVAQLHAHRGDYAAALAAVRRRTYDIGFPDIWLVPSHKRDEGRYAALAGDTTGAIRAYQHYLTLRTDPDPELQAEVEGVRAALEELLAVSR